ncbi:hypothetical protein [Halomicrococcus sp. NG-SE-24]|uniref:hypothetical protein n=1 Tax=Halomicrococcus sp. NG-SE-24 TaxID=3436928 RepID=UPI003D9844CE
MNAAYTRADYVRWATDVTATMVGIPLVTGVPIAAALTASSRRRLQSQAPQSSNPETPMLYVMENSRTPINSGEEAVLDHLEQYLDAADDDETLTREDAVAHLIDQGVARADAQAHIEQLLLKGYLYEVDDKLRLPSRP